MKKLILTTLLLLPALLHAAPDERWYQVEIIIFSNNNSDYHQSEVWPIDYSSPLLEGSRELRYRSSNSGAKSTSLRSLAFTLLPNDQLQLTGAAERIRKSPDLQLELHLGWLQPGLAADKAVAVHIYDGMPNKRSRSAGAMGADGQPELPKLDGTLRLILSRYLHLESDLIWRDPLSAEELALRSALPVSAVGGKSGATDNEDEAAISAGQTDGVAMEMEQKRPLLTHNVYRMQQSRRMRSNETHYLDHPRFGIVARVTPYTPQQGGSAN